MNDHDHEHSLTREQYRQQQLRSVKNNDKNSKKDSWINRQRERFMDPLENHNRPGDQLIHRHHENEPTNQASLSGPQQGPMTEQSEDQAGYNRATNQQTTKDAIAEQKTARLRRRLNIAIVILILLIIAVYLILFLVD